MCRLFKGSQAHVLLNTTKSSLITKSNQINPRDRCLPLARHHQTLLLYKGEGNSDLYSAKQPFHSMLISEPHAALALTVIYVAPVVTLVAAFVYRNPKSFFQHAFHQLLLYLSTLLISLAIIYSLPQLVTRSCEPSFRAGGIEGQECRSLQYFSPTLFVSFLTCTGCNILCLLRNDVGHRIGLNLWKILLSFVCTIVSWTKQPTPIT